MDKNDRIYENGHRYGQKWIEMDTMDKIDKININVQKGQKMDVMYKIAQNKQD